MLLTKNRTLLSCALLAALTGCAIKQPDVKKISENMPSTAEKANKKALAAEDWNSPGISKDGVSKVVLYAPTSIPSAIANQKVDIELDSDTSVQDLVAVVGKMGVSIMISDPEIGKKPIYVPKYKGTLGGFLSAIGRSLDCWFVWEGGAVVVAGKEKIGITIPQEKKFAEFFTKELAALGVKGGASSQQAGVAFVELTPSEYRKVSAFINRITENAAVVSMQVAILNVALTQNTKQGIDWDKLQIAGVGGGNASKWYGSQTAFSKLPTAGDSSSTSTSTSTTNTNTSTGTDTTGSTTTSSAASTLSNVAGLGLLNNGLQLAVFGDKFNFMGVFNFLQNYGETETSQSLMMKTFSGNTATLNSLTKIPYVSEVAATSSGTTSTSTTGSSKTDKANDGISIDITPTFDAYSETVTMEVNLKLEAVLAFNDLSAGNQIGKLTQPTTAERKFTDTIQLRPGQTAVIGGLTYDSVGNNTTNPLFLSNAVEYLKSHALTVSRQSMFIVIRPTVVKLGKVVQAELQAEEQYVKPGHIPLDTSADLIKSKKPAAPKK